MNPWNGLGVKRYSSEKRSDADTDWRHLRITLSPTNRDYQPIVLSGDDADHVAVIAEFVTVLQNR